MSTIKKLIGVRISKSLASELKEYCKSHGILINFFVAEAIKTKLLKAKRNEEKLLREKLTKNNR